VNARLGATARLLGDLKEAKGYYETAISIARRIEDHTLENGVLGALAELEFQSGNAERAVELCSQALNNLRGDIDWAEFIRGQQVNLTSYLLAQLRVKEARSVATDLFPRVRDRGGFALRVALMQWGLIAALENRVTEGALLLGNVDATFSRTGEIMEPTERHIHGQLSALTETFLSVGQREALAAEGASWTEDEAASFTMSRLISSGIPEAG
jgi:tetratricopeptide (TPR) repeat protein